MRFYNRFISFILVLLLLSTGALAEGFDSLLEGLPEAASAPDGSLGDLLDGLTEEQEDSLISERQLPLDGSKLAELGSQQLYKTGFSFLDNRVFSVYLFSRLDEAIVDSFINTNCEQRYYTAESGRENDIDFVVLSQYGAGGKRVVISYNFAGYTMLMVENGLAVENYHLLSTCSTCYGTGSCSVCGGTGHCTACGGSGYMGNCSSCGGSGWHDFCDGTGIRISEYTMYVSPCFCDNGICPRCDGTGHNSFKCYTCDASGLCRGCGGARGCSVCGGAGVQ